MQITFTPSAQEQLMPILASTHKKLKFLHDSKGSGCADNGVATLEFIEEPSIDDVEGIAAPFPFYYEPRHKVYYEDHMKMDYNTNTRSFILKSDSQIYNSHVRIIR
ncbi:MAG: iron-sulfur cluster biosynthesis family protein [Candidatus Pristimantibacillus lignocellulolyticus]|uniref:Iron-sulfur cluster biosynthesis family protein n=1 Tax=Candidatus Pristimantibacillus lignocellulolyticus TaxID=2994561 RepID=A0A9J6ZDJ3_9BACL|nr:MAG: iron-sulfur cluster biosynthesis family protein [Candidatus Pristimantibacillus lignocellulolyticus]